MTKPLQTMILYYRDLGMRVDEVLFQEVDKTIKRVQELEKDSGEWEIEAYTQKAGKKRLEQQNKGYREAIEEIETLYEQMSCNQDLADGIMTVIRELEESQ